MISATGRQALRRRVPKNPLKLAAGKRTGAAENHISKAIKRVRSSHLGYDCYTTGPVNGKGKIRCVLRPGRLPSHIANDVRLIMPVELYWPERDHTMAHGMLDAILSFDLSSLRAWKESFPEHEFGFEQYIGLAERRAAAVRAGSVPAVPQLPPRLDGVSSPGRPASVAVPGGVGIPRQLALFPGKVTSVERMGLATYPGYKIRLDLVRFNDGNAAQRVDVGGILDDGSVELCTSAYVDLVDGRYEIVEHYPGRLRALGLPVRLIYQVLGVRAPGGSQQPLPRTESRPAPRRGIRSAAMADGRAVGAVLATGDPRAEVADNPTPAAKLAELETIEDGTEIERFPDAPGHERPKP